MKASAWILFFGIGAAALPAWAQVSVRAEVQPNPATVEDEINLTVSVEGSIQATEPVLPSMPAFKVVSAGVSSSIEIINGSMNSKKAYNYVLIPLEEGKFRIGPISVFARGQEYQTNPIDITVSHSAQVPRPPPPGIQVPGASPDPFSQNEPGREPLPNQGERGMYWIETRVSDREPYVNEQILFTFRFYTRVQVNSATLTLPDFKDFWSEEVVPEKKYYQTIGGERYVVSEKIVALYPLKSGEAAIGETLLRADFPSGGSFPQNPFDDFFSGFGRPRTKPKNLKAPSIDLKIKPLPEGAPPDFTDLVGHFQVTAALSEPEIKVGESTTLNIEIEGRGNIKDAVLPDFFKDPAFKAYDDKPSLDIVRKEDGLSGKKSFKKALVPVRPGEFSIPPVTLSFFNPKTAQYETMTAPELSVKVLPSEAEALNPSGANPNAPAEKPLSVIQEDLASLHSTLRIPSPLTQGQKALLAVSALFPPLLFLFLSVLLRRKALRQANEPLYRERRALKKFNQALKRAAQQESLPLILEAIRGYVGDRSSVYGKSLTRPEMIRHLKAKGIQPEPVSRLEELVGRMEAACYGGLHSRSLGEWIREALSLIQEIDRSLKA